MSIGFMGAGTTNKVIDVYSGNAGISIDASLQNVLGKYDTIRTDYDRLIDTAQQATFDPTSRAQYNNYLKESVNGWSETWYSEYRAVLALRADALQKKLQASYNRVLEKSAYAEMAADQNSVFAPYANRTNNGAAVNYKMPAASTFYEDTPSSLTAGGVGGVGAGTNSDVYVRFYSDAPADAGGSKDYRVKIRNYILNGRAANTPDGNTPPNKYGALPVEGYGAATDGYNNQQRTDAREAQIRWTIEAVQDAVSSNPYLVVGSGTPPLTQAQHDRYFDGMVEASLQTTSANLKALSAITQSGVTKDKRDDNDIMHWINGPGAPAPVSFPPGSPDGNPPYTFSPPAYMGSLTAGAYRGRSSKSNPKPNPPDSSYYGNALESAVNSGPRPPGSGGSSNDLTPATAYKDSYKFADLTDGNAALGFPKLNIPMFGTGDFDNIDVISYLPQDIKDTLTPAAMIEIRKSVSTQLTKVKSMFIGRQYDDIVLGNRYEDTNFHTSLGIYPGQSVESITRVDEINKSGSIIQSGSRNKVIPSINVPIPVDIQLAPAGAIHLGFDFSLATGPDVYYGHTSTMANLSSETDKSLLSSAVGALTQSPLELPQIGFAGILFDFKLGVGVEIADATELAQPVFTLSLSFSYDILNKLLTDILKKLKTVMVEALQVNSYAASSGTAMDSYASRGEYHMAMPGFSEAMKTLSLDFDFLGQTVSFNFGNIFDGLLFNGISGAPSPFNSGILTAGTEAQDLINGTRAQDRLLGYTNSVQGAESRETETGAFFATNAFLSQFELSKMNSEYWVGTQQNEEVVNMDFGRAMLASGKKISEVILKALGIFQKDRQKPTLMQGDLLSSDKYVDAVGDFFSDTNSQARLTAMMYDILYRDQDAKGGTPMAQFNLLQSDTAFIDSIDIYDSEVISHSAFGLSQGLMVPRIPIVPSTFKSEAYDYIENDHKPFEGDSDFNYNPSSGPLSFMNNLFNAGTPDFILDGYANTKRFVATANDKALKKANVDIDNYDPEAAGGVGPRGHAGRGGSAGTPDGTFWTDTPLGDINEVYVGTRKVSFNSLATGFGEFTSSDVTAAPVQLTDTFDPKTVNGTAGAKRTVEATLERFVGADDRTIGRRYDPADPLNMETFNAGMYSGGKEHYDRRNQYSLDFTTKADGNKIQLFGSQALNPTFGGSIKMGEIDKNKNDQTLLQFSNVASLTSTAAQGDKLLNVNNVVGISIGSKVKINGVAYDVTAVNPGGKTITIVYKDPIPANQPQQNGLQTAAAANTYISGEALGENVKNISGYSAADQQFGGAADGSLNELNQTLYEAMHLRADGKNMSTVNEYRDVFNTGGLMKNIFISGQTYHPTGGGITSSIEIRFDPMKGTSSLQNNTREDYAANYDPYYTPWLSKSKGKAEVFLNSYFSYKKRAANKKT